MSSDGPAAPAGWYPDPQRVGQLRYWDGFVWSGHTAPEGAPPPTAGQTTQTLSYYSAGGYLGAVSGAESFDQTLCRRLSDYARWSGWAWLTLGVLQVLSVVGVIAGLWNIYVATTRIKWAPQIAARQYTVPRAVESLVGYAVIGVINLFFGAAIGIAFVLVDLYVRDQILKNRHLFTEGEPTYSSAVT